MLLFTPELQKNVFKAHRCFLLWLIRPQVRLAELEVASCCQRRVHWRVIFCNCVPWVSSLPHTFSRIAAGPESSHSYGRAEHVHRLSLVLSHSHHSKHFSRATFLMNILAFFFRRTNRGKNVLCSGPVSASVTDSRWISRCRRILRWHVKHQRWWNKENT